ncbi:MAG TPA: hypothetical protein VFD56_12755, partial [Chitinophagaceae bacterium]|nr:hypothetical protein [Chitinophagaceae bacterium]
MNFWLFPIRFAKNFLCFIAKSKFVYILLPAMLMQSVASISQTTPLTFTQVPYSAPDIISPGRG